MSEETLLQYRLTSTVRRPVEDVFRAIVDPKILCSYFTTYSSGPLEAGRTVTWMWGGESEAVHVEEVVPDEKIAAGWRGYRVDYSVRFVIELEPKYPEDHTRIVITETGWRNDPPGRSGSYEHCSGWTDMLMCLKARLEHDIDLR